MGTVVYSANLLWAFAGPLFSILFTSGVGIFGLDAAFRQRKQGKRVQITLMLCGVLLLAFSFVTASQTVASILSGSQTVAMRINDKSIATANCGNGGTCTHYIVAATAGRVRYDLIIDSQAYHLVHANTCYQVTFYGYRPVLSNIPDTNLYHRIQVVTRMATLDPAICS